MQPPLCPNSPAGHHVRPYIHETPGSRALHFSLGEMQSRMQTGDPHALDLAYTRTMMGFLLFCPAPAAIVMIGLGGGSLAKFCHRHLPQTRIEVAEINPHVIALREAFEVPADGPRFRVVQADGALFVREQAAGCEVLLVDGFDADGQPADLCSQRFYDDCCALLPQAGLLVVNLPRGDAQFDSYLGRIRRSFGDAVLTIDDSDGSNSIVFARKGAALAAPRSARLRALQGLGSAEADSLRAGFARIAAALKPASRPRRGLSCV